jgi:site-specific DNA recombinase
MKNIEGEKVMRVALYSRVSTQRQADREISVLDQMSQMRAYCVEQGFEVVAEFQEAGHTGTDDNRPRFRELIDSATSETHPFDMVLVHSFSRFARDQQIILESAWNLRRCGVQLRSMTQELNLDDPLASLILHVLAFADAQFSRENSKHAKRAMKQNALAGHSNGVPPYGYRAVASGVVQGDKIRKKLVIEPAEARTVRLAFQLYLDGDGTTGPLGVNKIARYLNDKGYRKRGLRGQAKWGAQAIHEMLTRPTYIGLHQFRLWRKAADGSRTLEESIEVPVEPIIDPETFHRVQTTLKQRNPKVRPPRLTHRPSLLSEMAICAACGSPMVVTTGKSGAYRYYSCNRGRRFGSCRFHVRADVLDAQVGELLAERLFTPERMAEVLESGVVVSKDQARMEREQAEAEAMHRSAVAALENVYKAIEQGLDPTEPVLQERLAAARQRRETALDSLKRLKQVGSLSHWRPKAEQIEGFCRTAQDRFLSGPVEARKPYLLAIIDRIEVGPEEVRVLGRQDVLRASLIEGSLNRAPMEAPGNRQKMRMLEATEREKLVAEGLGASPEVPTSVPKWRARQDSNL